jgi:hypothetical protein
VDNPSGQYFLRPERLRQLNDIRALRDRLLMPFETGRRFSAWYYAVGPYAAAAIRHNEPVKAVIRAAVLNPLSALSRDSSPGGEGEK